jgi:hypothetical protein
MERLTEWNDEQTRHAYYPRCFKGPCYGSGCKIKDCPFETAVCERLAAYEDSGCEPEEVLPKDKADEITLKLMRLADLESFCNYTRLRELAEADKDGRCVVLPCKPGAEVWVTRHDKVWPMYFVAPTLSAVCPDMPVHCQKDTCAGGPCKAYFGTDAREFGKTVFLTREEAEKALEEMGKA